jgi:hypothetical protein
MSYRKPDPFKLLIYIMAAVVALWAVGAFKKADAGEVTLSWSHPTTYEDNTALPLSDIARTEIEYAKCNSARTGFMTTATPVIVAVAPPPSSGTIPGLAPGAWCFHARTVTVAGAASVWTGFVNTTVVDETLPRIPSPPSTLTVNPTARTAYSIVKRTDRLLLVAVGTVTPGTACDPTQQVNGFFVVPKASVVLSGGAKPDVAVAACL